MGDKACIIKHKVRLMAIDPGKANGWAVFTDKSKPEKSGTLDPSGLYGLLESEEITHLVYESYRLYATHANQMIGDDFIAPQVIGVIKYLCEKRGIPYWEQPATLKAYYNDNRLKKLGLYVPVDHRRDAIRHGLYFLNFGKGQKLLMID
jgi:hypothetical protein